MTTLVAVMFASLLSAGPATSQSEALTRARVNAYIGSESTTAEDWRQLDASAVPFLTKVIGDRDESPPRRVRAMAGLSLLGSRNDIRSLMDVARAEGEAMQIRVVALRYAISRYSKAELVSVMKGLLRDSPALRMRLIAAEHLTRLSRSSGCASVRAQVEREKPRDQKSFQRVLSRCPPPPPPPQPPPPPPNPPADPNVKP